MNEITLASTSSCKVLNTIISNVISFTSQDVIISNLNMTRVKPSTGVYILIPELLQKDGRQIWETPGGLCINKTSIYSGKDGLCLKHDRRQGQTPNNCPMIFTRVFVAYARLQHSASHTNTCK